MATASSANDDRRFSTRRCNGSSEGTVAASRTRISASARARVASAERRAAVATTVLTIAATTTKITSASRFSASSIVQVWVGGVKYQFASRNAATTVAIAVNAPPITATTTTTSM